MKSIGVISVFLSAIGSAYAAPTVSSTPSSTEAAGGAKALPEGKTRYRSGKDVNFEELLIQGELKRPELSVITGNVNQGTDGLLRLRENFVDRLTADAGEDTP